MEIVMMLGLLVVTLGFGWIAGKLGFAKVVGQLIAGVVVGPALLGLVAPSHLMHVVSEFGVMLLSTQTSTVSHVPTFLKTLLNWPFLSMTGVQLTSTSCSSQLRRKSKNCVRSVTTLTHCKI